MSLLITPALLSSNFCNLERDIRILEEKGMKSIHMDVMDGNFVNNLAFGIDQIRAINKITDLDLEVHLLVKNPEKYIAALVDAGVDCITVHEEACLHLYKTIHFIKSFGIKAGVALNPATNITNLKYVMESLNKVLIMTVEPGFIGQSFIPFMKEKISDLYEIKREKGYEFEIQVDGGINLNNIRCVAKCGAANFVIGTAIFENDDIGNNIERLKKCLEGEL